MSEIEELKETIKRLELRVSNINELLSPFLEEKRWQKISEASETLGISAFRLRKWCSDGTLGEACHPINDQAQKVHYLIDVINAPDVLSKSFLKRFTK